ncbi:MAG: metallophosphoesterase [Gemmatimonadales bacterium]|nr:metallophosphoesterase [Gemmatimonadales bacterium]NIN11130.1 metallophosphoesterase [Gemmatimonadales bacterium]NIN49729.1 metallophosphoesterase [Gemmatimonadales bacterium]NIP07193.1 metallophosphoesterase [Gemmatimonadales bacterium]NIR00406.1 metallophosphoesterase [Gemmatimonadales bacterium]
MTHVRRLLLSLSWAALLPAASGFTTSLLHTPTGQPSDQSQETIRILAYNIRHGLGMDEQIDLERTARVIQRLDPDVVALQEVDRRAERTGGVDQAAVMGELTGMHAVFGDFMDYQGGQYGMALLSKYPIAATTKHRLPEGREPRSALAATIRVGESGAEVIVVGIHLYATAEERYAQASRIVDIYENEGRPVILAGDFNSTPESEVMALLRQSWTIPAKGEDHLTFPSTEPDREIDFIIYRPRERFEVVESRVIHEPIASDHRPVLLEVVLRDR